MRERHKYVEEEQASMEEGIHSDCRTASTLRLWFNRNTFLVKGDTRTRLGTSIFSSTCGPRFVPRPNASQLAGTCNSWVWARDRASQLINYTVPTPLLLSQLLD